MYPCLTGSPNRASYGEGNSVSSRNQLPSTVILKHLKHNIANSEGTGTTYIGASPLSAEEGSPVHVEHYYEKTKLKHCADNSRPNDRHATVSSKKMNSRKDRHRRESNNLGHSSHMHSEHRKHLNDIHHETLARQIRQPSVSTSDSTFRHRKHRNKKTLPRHNETLTWRMDRSVSLSDFTLTVIGINDRDALEKHLSAKKERKKEKHNKRRDKWMVEGLYLDVSLSEEDSKSDECRSIASEEDQGCGREHRDDVNMHPKISRTKKSNYPVVEEYYTHKTNLAVGMRSCDYFARLFREDTSSNVHSIEIPQSCLPAIPEMLDYLYHPDPMIPVNATTSTAIPLRYLGTLLGNHSLFESATHFLHMDLRPKTAIQYLQHAELYGQKKLVEVCIRMCAENFDQLKITWFASLAPRLMKMVLRSRHFTHSIDSQALCSKIAAYCRCQLHNIDRATLLALTDVKVMPVVCPGDALFFIQNMIRLGMDMEGRINNQYISSKERNLYERCINAASEVVHGIIGSLSQGNEADSTKVLKASRQTKNAYEDYSRLPPHIKVDLLEYALAAEQQNNDR